MIVLEDTSRRLFPIKLVACRTSIWHMVVRGSYHTGDKIRYTRNVLCGSGFEYRKDDSEGKDAIILNSPAEVIAVLSSPTLRDGRLCKSCRAALEDFTDTHPDMRGAPAMAAIVDRTKPIAILADGQVRQAEAKTIQAAKDLAKQIVIDEGVEVTVMVPRSTFKRKEQPVQEIGHKPR